MLYKQKIIDLNLRSGNTSNYGNVNLNGSQINLNIEDELTSKVVITDDITLDGTNDIKLQIGTTDKIITDDITLGGTNNIKLQIGTTDKIVITDDITLGGTNNIKLQIGTTDKPEVTNDEIQISNKLIVVNRNVLATRDIEVMLTILIYHLMTILPPLPP